MGFVADIVGGAVDAVGSAVSGVANAVGNVIEPVSQIASFIPGPWQLPAMAFNAVDSLAHGNILGAASSAFGMSNLGGFSGLTGFQGAAGATLDAAQLSDAVNAYTAAGYTTEQAMNFVSQAAGTSANTLAGIMSGGGTLNMANQGLVGYSGGLGGAINSVVGQPAGSAGTFGNNSAGMSSVLGGTNTLGNIAKIGSNLYNAYQGTQTQTPQQAQTSADPYAQYRAENAAQLNQLVANPASLTQTAGYQQGLNAALTGTQRQLAQTGQSMSGMANYNMALTSGDYFNTQFNQQYNRLAQLSGASQQPYVGQQANAAQQELKASSDAASQTYMKDAIGGIQGLLQSYWG